jgi:hypothetical protein
MRIEVTREAPDRLSRQVWELWLVMGHDYALRPPRLLLDSYTVECRQTSRHRWWIARSYRRLDRRDSSINAEAVPLPDDVIAEAKARICEAVMALEVVRG